MTMASKLIVIGAGIGGLAAAIRLRSCGFDVTMLERLPEVGGRSNRIELKGFKFDTGPTLLTMIDELRATFEVL